MGRRAIDLSRVPFKQFAGGARMPAIGLGTFGSDRYSAQEIAGAVRSGAETGYRHFDCAAIYGNEAQVGGALSEVMAAGITRDELWVTSKLWNDSHAENAVIPACERSLHDLGLEYLDLYLIHWPFPNHHAPGASVTDRHRGAKPYLHDAYIRTWRQLEKLVERGLVRYIGTSNMTVPKLELLLRDAEIKPAANEMELHPYFQQPALFDFVVEHGIVPIGFSPIGSPNRPERDKTESDTIAIQDPVIVQIAERLGVHPAVVCLKWAVQRGQVPIPFSIKSDQQYASLHALTTEPLNEAEMQAIAGIDKKCRLIKGQVFLWREGQDWQDLWDHDGHIAM